MKKETRRSCSTRKRIESEYCRLKGSFTENPHGRVEITHGRVPVVEEQTKKTHSHVEITHGRVLVTEEQAVKTHGPVEIPQGRVNGRMRASRDNTWACGNSTRPCGNSNLQIKLQIYIRVREKS